MPKIVKVWLSVPPIFFDGFLVLWVSIGTAMQLTFTQEDAYKYVSPYVLYWIKAFVGAMVAGGSALQAFRSKSYSEYSERKRQQLAKDETTT